MIPSRGWVAEVGVNCVSARDHRWRFSWGNLLGVFFFGEDPETNPCQPQIQPLFKPHGGHAEWFQHVSTLSKLPSLLRITVPKLHSLKMFKASASRSFFITLLLLPQHREQTESFAKTVRTCSSCGYIRKQGIPQTQNMTPLTFRGGQLLIHPHPSNFFVAQVFYPHFLASWQVCHSNCHKSHPTVGDIQAVSTIFFLIKTTNSAHVLRPCPWAREARPLPKRGFFPMRMGAQISTPNDGYPDYTTVWGTVGWRSMELHPKKSDGIWGCSFFSCFFFMVLMHKYTCDYMCIYVYIYVCFFQCVSIFSMAFVHSPLGTVVLDAWS